ncbi:MAG: ABC transporter permease [Spirochaetales bacterium]|nr:MAG: ABC transporter permease [Spirochaetales bacterium]
MIRSVSRKMWTVAKMEFRLTAANKAFVIITILGPFLIVAISVLPSLLVRGDVGAGDPGRIGLMAPSSLMSDLTTAFGQSPVVLAQTSADELLLEAGLQNNDLDAYVVVPPDVLESNTVSVVSKSGANFQLIGTIDGVVGQVVVARRLSLAGLDPAEVRALTQTPRIDVRRIDAGGAQQSQDMASIIFTTMAFTMMLYMTILLYGQAIGRSVLAEKLSKTVEIMLSSLSPRELLIGKILGKAGASLLQYGIWIGMAALVLKVIGPMVNLQISAVGGFINYIYLVGFFLLAFLLYSAIYAALGAASEDEQHLGQLAWPVILFLVIPMVMIGGTATNPDGIIPRILSLIPLTSPIVMFQRLLIGSPAAWEVAACLVLLAGTIIAMALFAAKIFRIGILMTGKRFTLGEIVRWVRYRG